MDGLDAQQLMTQWLIYHGVEGKITMHVYAPYKIFKDIDVEM